jgi:hypothetical protein
VSGGCYYIRFHFQFHTYIIAISFLTCTDCNTPTTIDRTHVGTWTMWRRRACHQYNHPGKNSLLRNHAFYCPKLDANLRGIVRSPQGLPQRPAHFSVRYDFFLQFWCQFSTGHSFVDHVALLLVVALKVQPDGWTTFFVSTLRSVRFTQFLGSQHHHQPWRPIPKMSLKM